MAQATISRLSVAGEDECLPEQEDLEKLASLIARFAPHDGSHPLSVPEAHVVKSSKVSDNAAHTMSKPGICIAAQGVKSVSLAQENFQYGAQRMVVYAAEVPVRVRFVEATPAKPYLCLVVHIEPRRLTELIFKVFPDGLTKQAPARAIYLGESNRNIVKSAIRILELAVEQENADLLVPLAIDEILIRLLRSPAGPQIAQIGLNDSNAHKVSRAISWIKENYALPLKVDDLARIAGMSASSFHTHFKSVTSMSPLQFQKNFRLQEARNCMIAKKMDVSSACHEVGYASLSQFSREYSRLFGTSPSKDIERYTNS